ncbi:unnamed protein product [Sphenostylis stenocarpa]|uniref:Uncharacterized protein n=1 Tax=Sphenostylis stenocarpa TaxID=92480 RepID=A0AA86VT15_9FABA|nr:unnamed protein product [Sphenostylis stenocarpa]
MRARGSTSFPVSSTCGCAYLRVTKEVVEMLKRRQPALERLCASRARSSNCFDELSFKKKEEKEMEGGAYITGCLLTKPSWLFAPPGRDIPALRTGREGLPSSGSPQGNLHSLLPLISSLYHIMGVYRRSQRLARKGCYTIPFDSTLL